MDLEAFLQLESQNQLEEYNRLYPKMQIMQNIRNNSDHNNQPKEVQTSPKGKENKPAVGAVNERNKFPTTTMSSKATDNTNVGSDLPSSNTEYNFSPQPSARSALEIKSAHSSNSQEGGDSQRFYLKKSAKGLIDEKETPLQNYADDMEQWVSDTFYSYFPAYNNEYQKRQHYLRERQAANQQNFLKHQMSQEQATKSNNFINTDTPLLGDRRPPYKSSDKTELQIIVNNPTYVLPNQARPATNTRPGSTRQKLLEDLRHTELSQVLSGEGVSSRNLHNAEMETARKKDYQRELMQQIEEKRRALEIMREKERLQDAVLTKRLQGQLETIHLEEQLEKEKLRAEKVRFDAQQNRLIREQLLAKLNSDAKLLNKNGNKNDNNNNNENNGNLKTGDAPCAIGDDRSVQKETLVNAESVRNNNSNKVYKYFSNSARHEYRRGQTLPPGGELNVEDIPLIVPFERECFHLSEKMCPMCDAPLRNYESCCLHCQRNLSLRLLPHQLNATEKQPNARCCKRSGMPLMKTGTNEEERNGSSFSLVCVNCERLYSLCPRCVVQSDVCRACHRKRNVCMSCRRTLCTFCLEEIASGRDSEVQHINEVDCFEKQANKTESPVSERSFQVLEVQYDASPKESYDAQSCLSPAQTSRSSHASFANIKNIHNNLHSNDEATDQNVSSFSFFQRNINGIPVTVPNENSSAIEQLPKIVDKRLSFEYEDTQSDAHMSMERVRRETDKRLSRYMKNYGDLTLKSPTKEIPRSKSESRNRGTQTKPTGEARRDIVLHEEYNLSMPLLREMPKMTRKENVSLLEQAMNNQRKIDNLQRRWEIPAVQKFSISAKNPKVLTQVGAIRQQLQAQCLRDEQNY